MYILAKLTVLLILHDIFTVYCIVMLTYKIGRKKTIGLLKKNFAHVI